MSFYRRHSTCAFPRRMRPPSRPACRCPSSSGPASMQASPARPDALLRRPPCPRRPSCRSRPDPRHHRLLPQQDATSRRSEYATASRSAHPASALAWQPAACAWTAPNRVTSASNLRSSRPMAAPLPPRRQSCYTPRQEGSAMPVLSRFSRWRLGLACAVLLLTILVAVPLVGWWHQGESARSRCDRIQVGMTYEEVETILEGWSPDLGIGGLSHMSHRWESPGGDTIWVSFEVTGWPDSTDSPDWSNGPTMTVTGKEFRDGDRSFAARIKRLQRRLCYP